MPSTSTDLVIGSTRADYVDDEGLRVCHPKLAMVTCADLAAFWDQVIARFLAGGPAMPSDARMHAWAAAYRGRGRGEVSRDALVTARMRPDPGIVREFVWQPVRELGTPVFAFGKPWFGLLEDGLGLQVVDRLGAGGRPYPTEVPSRTVLVLRGQDGPVVIAERHRGGAGPPRRSETRVLREAIEPWLGEP
jgi:hypothetical protein